MSDYSSVYIYPTDRSITTDPSVLSTKACDGPLPLGLY